MVSMSTGLACGALGGRLTPSFLPLVAALRSVIASAIPPVSHSTGCAVGASGGVEPFSGCSEYLPHEAPGASARWIRPVELPACLRAAIACAATLAIVALLVEEELVE